MSDELSIIYSGGPQNTKQEDSLGGFPSSIDIGDEKNNLFDDVTAKQTTDGSINYRCFYIFNESITFKYNISLHDEYLTETGATVELGVLLQNEVQSITFPDSITSGTFTITVQGVKSDVITWSSNSTTLSDNIKNGLANITNCSIAVSGRKYSITFKGNFGNKALSTLSITDNTLGATPTVARVTTGSPVNTVAPDIGNEKVPPAGIVFVTVIKPKEIGIVYPSEGFPLWIKRTVSAGFEPVEDDGFELKITAVGITL